MRYLVATLVTGLLVLVCLLPDRGHEGRAATHPPSLVKLTDVEQTPENSIQSYSHSRIARESQPGDVAQTTGTISVDLACAYGASLRDVRVELYDATTRIARKSTDRRVEFAGLAPGQYQLRVEPESLPEQVLVPRKQHRQTIWNQPDYSAAVEVVAQKVSHVRIELEMAAHVYGYIYGPDGAALRWAHARFGSMEPKDTSVDSRLFDLENGFYEGYLYPGLWAAKAGLGVSRNAPDNSEALTWFTHPLREMVKPIPVAMSLMPGESREVTFKIEGGPCSLTGKLLDQEGEGFSDLDVFIYPEHLLIPSIGEFRMGLGTALAKRVTGPDGSFNIAGLQPGSYMLQIEPEGYCPLGGSQHSIVGQVLQPMHIQIQAGENSFTHQIPRAYPVEIYGQVIVNQSWATPRGVLGQSPRVTLVLPASEQRRRDKRHLLSLNKEGEFRCYLESRERDAYLEVTLDHEISLVPVVLPPVGAEDLESTQGVILFP